MHHQNLNLNAVSNAGRSAAPARRFAGRVRRVGVWLVRVLQAASA